MHQYSQHKDKGKHTYTMWIVSKFGKLGTNYSESSITAYQIQIVILYGLTSSFNLYGLDFSICIYKKM